ncbi:hypothetical protein [Actinacidiphila glaucinigra]|uniref:hypothetical protein n=1 Tax=Actinacidiphila glaucinigra TaxID=235986 RepID=UPI00366E1BD6
MSTAPALDPTHTALLVIDYQPAILDLVPEGEDRNTLLGRVEEAIVGVRANGGTIAYVRVGFPDLTWPAASSRESAAADERPVTNTGRRGQPRDGPSRRPRSWPRAVFAR